MTAKSDFRASNVDLDKDWDDMFYSYWESWKDPVQITGVLTFAWLGEADKREAASYEAAKKDYLALARASPDTFWVKVEDCRTRRIVAGGAWTRHRKNPFQESKIQGNKQTHENGVPNITLPGLGYSEGSERHILMCEFYAQMWHWRPQMMKKPHARKLDLLSLGRPNI
jgi:hypothetical protein